MTKKPEIKAEKPATFSFEFRRSETDPKLFNAKYFRDGVLTFEVPEAVYIMCAAVMERKLRLAVHE